MTDPTERDPDFADEHSRPTFGDEQQDDPGMEDDESTPDSFGGMDQQNRPTPL